MKYTMLIPFVMLAAVMTQALSSSAKGHGRVSMGVEAGMNLSNATHSERYINPGFAFGYKPGLKAGVPVQVGISPSFYIRTGAYYSGMGYNNQRLFHPFNEEPIITNVRLHYLEVPLSAVFRFGKSRKVYAGGGAYFAYLIDGDGRLLNSGVEYKTVLHYTTQYEAYSRADYGAQLLGGIKLSRGFFAQLQISKGLANIQGNPTRPDTYRNFGATVSAGWMIGSKK